MPFALQNSVIFFCCQFGFISISKPKTVDVSYTILTLALTLTLFYNHNSYHGYIFKIIDDKGTLFLFSVLTLFKMLCVLKLPILYIKYKC
ncbi:hypothetical protein HanIR_Chr08g0366021 [Helianthus annuus]|nr:hypothetical protein HanIR_Chr08g0366021 [Helianthus annuus]